MNFNASLPSLPIFFRPDFLFILQGSSQNSNICVFISSYLLSLHYIIYQVVGIFKRIDMNIDTNESERERKQKRMQS